MWLWSIQTRCNVLVQLFVWGIFSFHFEIHLNRKKLKCVEASKRPKPTELWEMPISIMANILNCNLSSTFCFDYNILHKFFVCFVWAVPCPIGRWAILFWEFVCCRLHLKMIGATQTDTSVLFEKKKIENQNDVMGDQADFRCGKIRIQLLNWIWPNQKDSFF